MIEEQGVIDWWYYRGSRDLVIKLTNQQMNVEEIIRQDWDVRPYEFQAVITDQQYVSKLLILRLKNCHVFEPWQWNINLDSPFSRIDICKGRVPYAVLVPNDLYDKAQTEYSYMDVDEQSATTMAYWSKDENPRVIHLYFGERLPWDDPNFTSLIEKRW